MKKKYLRGIAGCLTASVLIANIPFFASVTKADASDKTASGGEILIMTKNSVDSDLSKSSEVYPDISVKDSWLFEDVNELSKSSESSEDIKVSLVTSDSKSTDELIDMFSNDTNVISVQPNNKIKAVSIPSDEYTDYQWTLDNKGQNGRTEGNDINVDSIWDNGITGTTNITDLKDGEPVIAVVDTGIAFDHPDLKDNIWNNPYPQNTLPGKHGYDFVNNDDDPSDDYGHGSHCAGIIAASANDTGIVGINQNTKLMALKVLNEEGLASDSEIIAAYCYIYKAQKLGANIIAVNNSWGNAYGESDTKYESVISSCIDMIGEQGALSIFAAGNDGSDIDAASCAPASCSSKYILSVAASNENDELASFSNYGAKNVDIAAPGADILSTVNYDCFNPTIYNNDVINNLCNSYYDFNNDEIPENISISDGTLSINHDSYFGLREDNSGSLSWTVTSSGSSLSVLKIPYSLLPSSTPINASSMINIVTDDFKKSDNIFDMSSATVSIYNFSKNEDVSSFLFKTPIASIRAADSSSDLWTHISQTIYSGLSQNKDGYIAIIATLSSKGSITVNLDDIGISKENVNSSEFGKYDFYNGTSMATPTVTGASGLIYASSYDNICNLPDEEKAVFLKEKLLSCCRKNDSLNGKVLTGGILDLSKLSADEPIITNVESDGKGVITIHGCNFVKSGTGGTLTVNGNIYNNAVFAENRITINDVSLLNKNNSFTITTSYGSCTYEKFVPKIIKKLTKEHSEMDSFSFEPSNVFSDGSKVYTYSNTYKYIYSYNDTLKCWDSYTSVSKENIFSSLDNIYTFSTDIDIAPGMTFYNGKLYGLATLSALTINNAPVLMRTFIICYNPEKSEWSYAEVPENITDMLDISFGIYNDSIYIAGGYNYYKKSFSTDVYTAPIKTFDSTNHSITWVKSASLPYGRSAAALTAFNGKLYLSGGICDTVEQCNTMNIFDGTKWNKISRTLTPINDCSTLYYNKKCFYSACAGGLYKNGLVFYSSQTYDSVGNVFVYNTKDDSYSPTDYYFENSTLYDNILFTVNNDKLFFLCYKSISDDDDIDFYSQTVTSPDTDIPNVSDTSDDSPLTIYTGDIESAYCTYKSAQTFSLKGSISGTGAYLYGDNVTITAKANTGYYPVSIKVGKKIYKGNIATFKAEKSEKISVTWGRYATSVKFIKNTVTIKSGRKSALKYSVRNATDKSVRFRSSNNKYATVNQKGVVTAKKAGKGKSVRIYIYTQDGSKLKASCKVLIR